MNRLCGLSTHALHQEFKLLLSSVLQRARRQLPTLVRWYNTAAKAGIEEVQEHNPSKYPKSRIASTLRLSKPGDLSFRGIIENSVNS